MKLIGIGIILNSLAFTAWWMTANQGARASVMAVCSLAVLVGAALAFGDRLTELTIKGVGTIKAASEQALADAQAVADLKARVENQSATVDLVAAQANSASQLAKKVEEQSKIASEKLSALNDATQQASAVLTETRRVLEFTELIVAAQSDDRVAWDKLRAIAEEPDNPFSAGALRAWNSVYEAHTGSISRTGFQVPWADGVDPSKFTLSDLRREYAAAPLLKQALLEYIIKRSDIPLIERLDFLVDVLRSDPSLRATEYAGRHFTGLTGLQIKPLAIEYLLSWWAEHRKEFVGK